MDEFLFLLLDITDVFINIWARPRLFLPPLLLLAATASWHFWGPGLPPQYVDPTFVGAGIVGLVFGGALQWARG